MEVMVEELESNETLALKLKVPVSTVRTWRMKGIGPRGFKVGKHVRYRKSDVDA